MSVELYHLRDDLRERHNVASQFPEKTQQLRSMLHDWRREVGAQMPTPNPAFDPAKDAKARLRIPPPPH
jgi:hypothetical protein